MADEATVEETEEAADAEQAAPEIERMHGAPVTYSVGQKVLHPTRDSYLDVVAALRADAYIMCIDVTAVDYLQNPHRDLPAEITPERYELVAAFINHAEHSRVRLRVQIPADDATAPSIFDEYPGAETLEREVFDMFGITFDNHPDMTRILMPEEWEGHPLRKDYDVGSVPVQFKAPEATGGGDA